MTHSTTWWSDTLKEWVLPYEAVRRCRRLYGRLRAFLDAIYMLCTTAAGWNRGALSYAAPKRPLPWPLELRG